MKLPWNDAELLAVEEMCNDLLLWYSFDPSATSWDDCDFCTKFRGGHVPTFGVPNPVYHGVYSKTPLPYCRSCPWVVFEKTICYRFASAEGFTSSAVEVSDLRISREPIEWVERRCVMLREWLRRIDMARIVRKRLEAL